MPPVGCWVREIARNVGASEEAGAKEEAKAEAVMG
jgi:hypothetical protein